MQFLRKSFIVLLLGVIWLNCLPTAQACGPFSSDPIFSYTKHPDLPFNDYAAGKVGVIRPSYARSYLYVAFRYFNSTTFSPAEQGQLTALWNERNALADNGGPDTLSNWLAARKKIVGGDDPAIEVYRATGKEDYDTFLNCTGDAFATARRTLEARASRYGAENAAVKDWVKAQDAVFSNCGSGFNEPTQANGGPTWLAADRAYQAATADFYAQNYLSARNRFAVIARDANSPWRNTANYLIARAYIREASLSADDIAKKQLLTDAVAQLKKVQADPANEYRDAATRTLALAKFRSSPDARLRELSAALVNSNSNLKQDLWDYTLLLDQFEKRTDDDKMQFQPVAEVVKNDELSAWLFAFQSDDAQDYTVQQWQKSKSLAWLVAALAKIGGNHPQAAALLKAADAVPPTSPAFVSVNYYAARLLIAHNSLAAARSKLDRILQTNNGLPPSARNALLSARMSAAANFGEFLASAPRQPVAYSFNEDGRELPDEPENAEQKAQQQTPLFDVDGGAAFNKALPLNSLREAATNQQLASSLRANIALAGWTKAAVLDDSVNALTFAGILGNLRPELQPLLAEYSAASAAPARKSIAVYLMLKFPATDPYIRTGTPRSTPAEEIDSYRDNWWCASDLSYNPDAETPAATVAPPQFAFLTAPQKQAAANENARLKALGTAPNYLCQQAIAWSDRDPNNPRVPEALALAVKATRYGCTDQETGKNSKAAFDVLKKRYPNTTWAQMTKYWYK